MSKRSAKPNTSLELKLNISLLTLIVVLFVLYIYFVSASVVHVVMRMQINNEMQQTSTEISQLDTKYIALQNKVSNDIASMKGYTEITQKVFINRDSGNLAMAGGGSIR